MKRDARGFTLLELLIALTIVGALLVIAFGGMRVALAAWRKGEDRAEAHQHVRSIALVLARSISATYPYTATLRIVNATSTSSSVNPASDRRARRLIRAGCALGR